MPPDKWHARGLRLASLDQKMTLAGPLCKTAKLILTNPNSWWVWGGLDIPPRPTRTRRSCWAHTAPLPSLCIFYSPASLWCHSPAELSSPVFAAFSLCVPALSLSPSPSSFLPPAPRSQSLAPFQQRHCVCSLSSGQQLRRTAAWQGKHSTFQPC